MGPHNNRHDFYFCCSSGTCSTHLKNEKWKSWMPFCPIFFSKVREWDQTFLLEIKYHKISVPNKFHTVFFFLENEK